MRLLLLASLPLLLAGCVGRPIAPGPPTAPPPVGQPVAPPPPLTVDRDGFALKGEITQGAVLLGTAPVGTALLLLDGKPVKFASDGRFLIGLDRDAMPTALLEARLQDGRLIRLPLAVSRRAWDISSLPALSRGTGSPSEAYRRIRDAEVVEIMAAKALAPASDGWRQQFRWPAFGRISTLFGAQRIYAGVPGSYHGGVDIARYADGPTLAGTPARSPADGVVVLATSRPFSLEGYLVLIDHGMGLVSALMHLQRVDVVAGQRVRQGDPVGLVGATGRATGPHLHWGLTWAGARLDPMLLVGPMPERAPD